MVHGGREGGGCLAEQWDIWMEKPVLINKLIFRLQIVAEKYTQIYVFKHILIMV